MRFPKTRPTWIAICATMCAMLGHAACAAPVVNFTTGLSLNLLQSTTGSLTSSLRNDGTSFAEINSFTLGYTLVQTAGSGTLTFSGWGPPASNKLLSDPDAEFTPTDPPTSQTLNAPVNISGTDYFDYFPVQAANTNGFNDQILPAATKNAGTLTFTSGTGEGTWDLYVVNQQAQSGGLPASFTQNAALAESGFGNLPATNGSFLKIGTISVVPEPSTVGVASMAILGISLMQLRSWRRGLRENE